MAMRLLFVLAAILFIAPSLAQTPGLPDVVLTPARVETVVTAYPLMRDRLAELDEQFDGYGDADTLASSLPALALAGAASGALNAAAEDHGFADFMDWISTTNAVFMAHAFAQHPEMDADVQAALDGIDSQPGLSAAQKEQMKTMILQSMGTLEAMRPPDENLAAVAPYHDAIEAMLQE
jgi:hypothetical protein